MRIKPKYYLLVLFLLYPGFLKAQLFQGPFSAGTGTNVGTGTAWTNPNNVTSSDDTYANLFLGFFTVSDALVASNFGFSIPLSYQIDGISVTIERKGTVFAVWDNAIQLTKDGTNPIGNNYAGGVWPAIDGVANYGGTTDLWGQTWTPAEINSSTFGVYIVAQGLFGNADVDHVTVRIDYSIPTPVELISFDGRVVEDIIELKWQTSWEKNNDFYTIEKSSNGLNYMELATIDGKGTTEFISEYIYIDPLPFKGNNYYRLTQTDYDGTYEVFKPIMIQYEETGPMMKIYPNPVVNQEVNLIVNPDLLRGENNNTYIIVRNITGEIVYQQNIPTDHLGEKISLNRRLASGMYIIELHSPYGNTSKKVVVD